MGSFRLIFALVAISAAHAQALATRDCSRAVFREHASLHAMNQITRVDRLGSAPGKLEVPGLAIPFETSVTGQAYAVWDEYMSGVGVTAYVTDERCAIVDSQTLYLE